ncbi:hypothetical protein V8C35DRAFT_328430 [Trichoderma chlorosporum]
MSLFLIYWFSYVFVFSLQEQRKEFSELETTRSTKFIIISVFIIIILTPTWFEKYGRLLCIAIYKVAARRVRWLFRFRREDIEANATAHTTSYTAAAFQNDVSVFLPRSLAGHDDTEEAPLPTGVNHRGDDNEQRSPSARETILIYLVRITMLGMAFCQIHWTLLVAKGLEEAVKQI